MRLRLRPILLPLLLMLSMAACSAVVSEPAEVDTPRAVQLLEHGRHSSLLLTSADQTRVRYAYADWTWYVENEQGLLDGARALLIPSKAAFGRQVLPPHRRGERLGSVIGVGIGKAYDFQADADEVDGLIASLDRQFNASQPEPVYKAHRNMWFVPHPRPYTFDHNSNHLVAGWLRELEFKVLGDPALGRWRVSMSEAERPRNAGGNTGGSNSAARAADN